MIADIEDLAREPNHLLEINYRLIVIGQWASVGNPILW